MSDVFLSYANADRKQAEVIARALTAQGWAVFWDQEIGPGLEWREVLERELNAAKCVVVVWSAASIHSHWVLEEAESARQRGVLVPALIDDAGIPLGFQTVQAADLRGWNEDPSAEQFQQLFRAVRRVLDGASFERETRPARLAAKLRASIPGSSAGWIVALSTFVVTLCLWTAFALVYPRVEIDFGLASVFVMASLVIVVTIRSAYRAIRR